MRSETCSFELATDPPAKLNSYRYYCYIEDATRESGLGIGTDAEGWIDQAVQFW